ncbi:c-type cytochrome biogenesis protein CcmI [Marinimicrobium sp. ARAG 43.8]|uniref:c-type cytochrome biogenesis protein CcmI n=1 Tax=Marinimicrobium sp. ARAG 43.8 TaxID=3418719 RepID=UPI003CFB0D96
MMAPLWWGMALLAALALAFFLWPLRRREAGSRVERLRRHSLETNITLFREHLAELEASRDAGRLSQEAFEQLKLEQERALLEEERQLASSRPLKGRALPGGRVLVVVALLGTLGSVLLYHERGASEDVELLALQTQKALGDNNDLRNDRRPDPARTWAVVEQLQQRVKENPESVQHLFLLANYTRELGHYDQAVDLYERILSLQPDSARIHADLAETLFIRDDNRIGERGRALVAEALQLNPEETTALGLAGIDAFSHQRYQEAIDYWERAIAVMDPTSGNAMAFRRGVSRARAALGEGAPEADTAPTADGGVALTLDVSLGDDVEVKGDETVFVYARAWNGSAMPLAIQRLQASQLPLSITLDETMAMSPAASLASVETVELVARLSRSGDVAARPGDWQATLGPVELADAPEKLTLVIDEPIAD